MSLYKKQRIENLNNLSPKTEQGSQYFGDTSDCLSDQKGVQRDNSSTNIICMKASSLLESKKC